MKLKSLNKEESQKNLRRRVHYIEIMNCISFHICFINYILMQFNQALYCTSCMYNSFLSLVLLFVEVVNVWRFMKL